VAIAHAEHKQVANKYKLPGAISFEELIRGNLQLVYVGLPSLYYILEIWYSQEAFEVMIAPDRRKSSLSPENNDLDDWCLSSVCALRRLCTTCWFMPHCAFYPARLYHNLFIS
jgi:hypothetical protein